MFLSDMPQILRKGLHRGLWSKMLFLSEEDTFIKPIASTAGHSSIVLSFFLFTAYSIVNSLPHLSDREWLVDNKHKTTGCKVSITDMKCCKMADGSLRPNVNRHTEDPASADKQNRRSVNKQKKRNRDIFLPAQYIHGESDTWRTPTLSASSIQVFCERLAMMFFQSPGSNPQDTLQFVMQKVITVCACLPCDSDCYQSRASASVPTASLNLDDLN